MENQSKKRKYKILTSLTYYSPNISGITVYAKLLNDYLVRKHEVTVLTSAFANCRKEEKNGNLTIKRIKVWLKINKGVLMPTFPFSAFSETIKNDLIICHLPQIEAIWFAFWTKITNKRFIVVHHCQFTFPPGIVGKIISPFILLTHLLTCLLADKIVFYTQDYASSLSWFHVFAKKSVFILPPVILERKNEEKIKTIAEKIGKDKKTKIIGFVGRIGWEKGIDVLINAIPHLKKHLPDFKIVLVGPYQKVIGDPTYKKIKKLIKKYQSNIVLTDSVAHKKLVNYYHNFDCLVLPSISNLETFGIVQAEAMVCGCPVVASNLPGVRVPVKLTDMGEIVPIGNHEALSKAIIRLITGEKKKYPGKIFAKANFFDSWQKLLLSDDRKP